MGKTGRIVLGVVAGVVLWGLLWVGGSSAAQAAWPDLIDPEVRLDHLGILGGYLIYSVILSLLAGYVAAAIGGAAAMRTVWILAVVQLGIGIFTEISYWDLTPVWYHLVFLALVVPATVAGGRMKAG